MNIVRRKFAAADSGIQSIRNEQFKKKKDAATTSLHVNMLREYVHDGYVAIYSSSKPNLNIS